MEVGRSVSGISRSQERRSRVGGGKIRLGPGNICLLRRGARLEDPSRTWEYKSFKERGAHLGAERSVSGISCSQERRSLIRLGPGNISLLRRGARRNISLLRRGAHRAGGWKIRLGPGNISLLRRGARRAGGWKIRLGHWAGGRKDPSLGDDPSRLKAEKRIRKGTRPK